VLRRQTSEEQLVAAGSALYYMPFMDPQRLMDAFSIPVSARRKLGVQSLYDNRTCSIPAGLYEECGDLLADAGIRTVVEVEPDESSPEWQWSLKGITLLSGAEVDILGNGSLDFDDALLAELDYAVASMHSGLTGPREKVTARTLKAMDNPYVVAIGHPTGRLIGQREAMDLDMGAVIEHAAQTGTALEINANPYRLDLRDIHCKMAVEKGVKLAIGTDAHSAAGLNLMSFGVATAARGWARRGDVLNTLSVAKLRAFLKAKRP